MLDQSGNIAIIIPESHLQTETDVLRHAYLPPSQYRESANKTELPLLGVDKYPDFSGREKRGLITIRHSIQHQEKFFE